MASNRTPDGRFKKGTHWRQSKEWWSKVWLEDQYVEQGKSAADIAKEFGSTENNILYWLRKHGIQKRTISEARDKKYWGASGQDNPMFGRCAEANPNWLGGVSPERQSMYSRAMWKEIKKTVLRRDKYTCSRCGKQPKGHKELHTHHPKSWKTNEMERFNPDNIITLCRRCHEWVHSKGNINHDFLET